MGFYLDSVLPNTFREHYKAKWLKEYTLNKPKFYLRYIDDKLLFKLLLVRKNIHYIN